ncbi:hypothetical protein ACFX13_022356 [Malus domestica]
MIASLATWVRLGHPFGCRDWERLELVAGLDSSWNEKSGEHFWLLSIFNSLLGVFSIFHPIENLTRKKLLNLGISVLFLFVKAVVGELLNDVILAEEVPTLTRGAFGGEHLYWMERKVALLEDGEGLMTNCTGDADHGEFCRFTCWWCCQKNSDCWGGDPNLTRHSGNKLNQHTNQ